MLAHLCTLPADAHPYEFIGHEYSGYMAHCSPDIVHKPLKFNMSGTLIFRYYSIVLVLV